MHHVLECCISAYVLLTLRVGIRIPRVLLTPSLVNFYFQEASLSRVNDFKEVILL